MSNSWKDFGSHCYDNLQVPTSLWLARGMLSMNEVKMLYSASAHFFKGAGSIVDAGAFAGMSAYSLASGLRANSSGNYQKSVKKPIISSYDLFETDGDYTKDYLANVFYTSRGANGDIKNIDYVPSINEDFLSVFWFQNAMFRDLIKVYKGDFSQASWKNGAIEILFVDVCKTLELNQHVVREFLPNMIEKESVLIQQDFHHIWHPYIHLTMEILKPYFEIVINGESASRVYRLIKAPPKKILEEASILDLDEKQILEMYRGVYSTVNENQARLLRVSCVKALADAKYKDAATAMADDLLKDSAFYENAWLSGELKRLLKNSQITIKK